MLLLLLLSTFISALLVAVIVNLFFKKPLAVILKRLIEDEIYDSWLKYMIFAIYVVSISSGISLWKIERYIYPTAQNLPVLDITGISIAFEMYRSIINSLTSIAWLLLTFFIVALIIFVVKRIFENKKRNDYEDN
ncbi:MAG: hypothetical protein RBS16_02165 [Candidatus Cloacimonadales bacterium]|jgi:hypothetical protein|nr:hypothetical protein [Candidatus Cloacimonadota bacterium]MDD2650902.1 hypothetical protein [Candidatus Cloacimonadota bacterium]MDX9976819.1 hypothetical protein [Candidatus Cloacimonadales bacterium]